MSAPERFDAVVVGSGFGGSVMACRLAEAGLSVLVLERGRAYPPGSFPRTPRGMKDNFWDPDAGLHGLYEVFSFSGLSALVASGLGGGSLIYANVMLRKDEDTFVRDDLDGGRRPWPVTRAQLEPHYDRVEAMQEPMRYPVDHEPYGSTPKTRAMAEAARDLGLDWELPPLAVSFADRDGRLIPGEPVGEPQANLHGRTRSTCRLTGECCIGCNYGSKNTLDYTYLSAAKRAGATLRTSCEARTIAPLDGSGYRVAYRVHGVDRAADAPTREVTATRVVLAAGTFGSTGLLLRNRANLPHLSPRLGSGFSANGDLLFFARNCELSGPNGKRRPRYLDPSRGPVITCSVRVGDRESAAGRQHFVQDAGGPATSEWLWHALELPADAWAMRGTALRRLRDRLRGRRDTSLGEELSHALGSARASAAMLPLLGMGRDVASGQIKLRGAQLDLDWSVGPSQDYFGALEATMRAIARALGARSAHDRLARLSRLVTVHPLGGCPMGSDPSEGVVDPAGEVFGHPGLHVADGAVMPGAVGANPSFTIAALADRFADAILERRPARAAA